jgi:hypothetical protein
MPPEMSGKHTDENMGPNHVLCPMKNGPNLQGRGFYGAKITLDF